ncbi:MAG: hypothetical protein HY606_05405 [Planctomycetes bacterium]|nr:hypothetical protein [Planctomycetota bacterium]
MNLILTGYKCSGKSTIGKILSFKLEKEYIDVDEFIEKQSGLTVREIFEKCGEEYFRILEGDAIRMIHNKNGAIVSTGGGVILLYRNIQRLSKNGAIFYLKISSNTALTRIQNSVSDKRFVDTKNIYKMVETEMMNRIPYYESSCDHKIVAEEKTSEQITDEIIDVILDKYGSSDIFFSLNK